MKQDAQPLEKLEALFRRHRKPDPKPSSIGDQIGSDQEDQSPHGSQPPLKPARGQHGLGEAQQRVGEDPAGAEGRIGGIERLEAERVEIQVLLEFLDPVLTVRSAGVHPDDQLCSKGHPGSLWDEFGSPISRQVKLAQTFP